MKPEEMTREELEAEIRCLEAEQGNEGPMAEAVYAMLKEDKELLKEREAKE